MLCMTVKVVMGYFLVASFPPDVASSQPPGLTYWQGSIARGFPLSGYGLRQIQKDEAELTLPDGRTFKFGPRGLAIDCPLDKTQGVS